MKVSQVTSLAGLDEGLAGLAGLAGLEEGL